MASLSVGTEVIGQVQDLPFPAPVLKMEVMRVDPEGAGLDAVVVGQDRRGRCSLRQGRRGGRHARGGKRCRQG
jgi:hypothetical protein